MKKLLVTGFIALYLLAMLKPIAPVMEYLVNYDYISKVLCINKDKVEMNCNGKCYLKMQLQESPSEKEVIGTIVMEDYPIGFVMITTLEELFVSTNKSNFFNTIQSPRGYVSFPIKPPRIII